MGRSLKVLAVDDHPVNLRYLELLLKGDGYVVQTCTGGRAAIHAASREVFDAVLMDLHMPEVNGEMAIAAIRALPAPYSEALIVVVTADTAEETRTRVLHGGANKFIAKPFSPEQLKESLRSLHS